MDMELFDKHAKKILEIALHENELDQFLIGRSIYALKVPDGYGNKVQSETQVMETIYSKYRETNDDNFAQEVYNAMIKVLRTEFYEPYIENLLHGIEYQLYAEKNNLAPFKMDCEFLLKELRNNLERNKERYTAPTKKRGHRGFWGSMEDEEEYLLRSFGMRIFDESESKNHDAVDENHVDAADESESENYDSAFKKSDEVVEEVKFNTVTSDSLLQRIKNAVCGLFRKHNG